MTVTSLKQPRKSSGIRSEVVHVTPELAAEWLGKNLKNRGLRMHSIRAYARDMEAGNWQLTGEAVKFDTKDEMLDGQHRMHAVIRSGKTVPMLVVWGLPSTAQDVMDSGIKRLAGDALHLSGYKNAAAVAAIARLAMSIDTMEKGAASTSRVITTAEIMDWVEEHDGAEEAGSFAMQGAKTLDIRPSVIGYCWLLTSDIDMEATIEFWTALINNATSGSTDPRSVLLKRFASARRRGEKLTQPAQVSLVLRAWNAWRRGQTLTSLPAVKQARGEGAGAVHIGIPKPV